MRARARAAAAARALIAPTALRFCGIAVEAPPSPPSRTSPTSVCASSSTSRPAFPTAPEAMSRAAPSSATRTRFVCQGSGGSTRPSSSAKRRAISSPCPPIAASVPAAPPSCAARPSSRSPASRVRDSSTATSQPAALSPNVVGTACCNMVRPAIGVSRCSRARTAHASVTRSSSPSTSTSARRATSMAAVSMMSWVVAPRCTKRAVSSPTRATTARTSGSTGAPTCRPSRSSCSQS